MKRAAINEAISEAGSEKVLAQSINVKISFDDKEDSFVNIKWTILNELIIALSDQWEFLAFGFDYKTAIISVFNTQVFDEIKSVKSKSLKLKNRITLITLMQRR